MALQGLHADSAPSVSEQFKEAMHARSQCPCGQLVKTVGQPLERTLLLQLTGLCLAGVAAHICVVLHVQLGQGVSQASVGSEWSRQHY